MDAAIAHIHAGYNAVPQWCAALDDPPAHHRYVVIGRISASTQAGRRLIPASISAFGSKADVG